MKNWKIATLAAGVALAATTAHAGPTLDKVKARGHIVCGASQGTVGFGSPDDKGYWTGLDVETCRAVAVAIFGDKDKVEFVPLSGQQRIPALQTGEIDILPRTLTWTLQRDANGINFATPTYYEFTGFMVAKSSGVTKVEEMTGASVCVCRRDRQRRSWLTTSPAS
ncbi:transporter substrate-binding domain-containing protein [Sinorhizobium meliloti]|uniref:transporter substrate-binding domain-containing protein n=1 Tax=Rhizobium meliloti TaxID=382 RepID=UPI00307E04FA